MKCQVVFILLFIIIVTICTKEGESARVLGLFPTHSKSHLIIQMEVIKTILDKHDVTVVTTLPLSDKHPKYRHIKLPEVSFSKDFLTNMIEKRKGAWDTFKQMSYAVEFSFNTNEDILKQLTEMKMMQEESFDLIIFGIFLNDFLMGLAAHFKCPLVIINTHKPLIYINGLIGNPSEIFYVPGGLSSGSQPLSFFGRVTNTLSAMLEVSYSSFYMRKVEAVYKNYFPSEKYPPFGEVLKNVSLILQTSHFSEGPIRPAVPGFIEIGGIQAKPKPDPLPQDLAKILDSASDHGAILFSLGTNAKSADRDPEIMLKIYNVLSNLKQTVLWKWEDDKFPGNASNIFFRKWLPQDDILAHPNVKLFVSHCGLGSVIESKFHGVPILAIPLFGDQFGSANGMVEAGFAVKVDYWQLTEESFESAVKEILGNSSYRRNIENFSKLYRDRPLSVRDTTAYWLEYVIRHGGAKHMQSPVVHMSFIEHSGLDIIAFTIIVSYVLYKALTFCLSRCLRKLRDAKSNKAKSDKAKKDL